MAFPDETIGRWLRVAFGADLTANPSTWVWTDLSERLLGNAISIEQGTLVGGPKTGATTANGIQCLNTDGALTPMLPTSEYYPYVDAGTPLQFLVRPDSSPVYYDMWSRTLSGAVGTADSGHTYSTVGVADMSVSAGTLKINGTALNQVRRVTSTYSTQDVDVVWDSSVSATALGSALVSAAALRYVDVSNMLWAHCEFLPGGTIQVKGSRFVAGVMTGLGQAVVPGLTYSPGTMIRTRCQLQGSQMRIRAWLASDPEPDVWHVDLVQTAYLAAGRVGFATWVQASSANTLPVTFTIDNTSATPGFVSPLDGYITDVQPQFLPQADGSTWSTVMISAGGVSSITERNESPAYSPLRRSVQQSVPAPIAYWPLEDAEGSVSGASAFPGGPKMVVTGPAVFAFAQDVPEDVYQSRWGTKPMVSLAAGARIAAPVTRSTVQTEWAVSLSNQMFVPDVPAVSEIRVLQWQTQGGTHARWAFVATDLGYDVRAYNDTTGASTNVISTVFGSYGILVSYAIEAMQNGGNIDVTLFVDGNVIGSGSIAGTLAAVSQISANPDRSNTTNSVTVPGLKFVVGHIRIVEETSGLDLPYYTDPATGITVRADRAWYLEAAHSRVKRLCAEERVPCTILGAPATTGFTQLNGQRDGAFTDLISQAAESESGSLLYESGFGYAYLARSARYSPPVALSIDLATYARSADTDQGDILVPQLDSRAPNLWTVQRHLGSTGSYAAPIEYRKRRGTIGQEVTVDVLTDAELDGHAAWRVHLAVDALDAYYPAVPLDLAANPDLITAWLACRPGSRVQRLNQPTIAGLGVVDQLIDGWSETIGPRTWQVSIAASPAKVWDVAVADQPLGKADTDGTTIRAANATATSLLVDVLAGPRWTTDPAQMPLLISLGTGEEIRVTAISGTSNPQTWTAVRSLNGVVRAVPADTPARLTLPALSSL